MYRTVQVLPFCSLMPWNGAKRHDWPLISACNCVQGCSKWHRQPNKDTKYTLKLIAITWIQLAWVSIGLISGSETGPTDASVQLLFTPNEIIWAVRLIAIAVLQARSQELLNVSISTLSKGRKPFRSRDVSEPWVIKVRVKVGPLDFFQSFPPLEESWHE